MWFLSGRLLAVLVYQPRDSPPPDSLPESQKRQPPQKVKYDFLSSYTLCPITILKVSVRTVEKRVQGVRNGLEGKNSSNSLQNNNSL